MVASRVYYCPDDLARNRVRCACVLCREPNVSESVFLYVFNRVAAFQVPARGSFSVCTACVFDEIARETWILGGTALFLKALYAVSISFHQPKKGGSGAVL